MSPQTWIAIGVTLLFVLIIIDIVLAFVWYENSWFYCPIPAEGVAVSTMRVFENATLFPYNGNWTTTQTGLTETQCVNQCLGDSACQAFYMHADPAVCYFYNQPQTQTMLGATVNVSSHFTSTTNFIIGRQTPTYSSTVYIKPSTPFSLFASIYDQPNIVLSENC